MAMSENAKNTNMSTNLLNQYRLGEACETAFVSWKAKLDFVSRKVLKADEKFYEAVANAFYGAKSQDELDALMGKTPEELANIGRGGTSNG